MQPTSAENAPSTLPQVLHLSYKNRGEFHLDQLRVHLAQRPAAGAEDDSDSKPDILVKGEQTRRDVLTAVKDFAEALDKDEDDVDLWRRTAKAAQSLGSNRLARFCLEAALQDNEESLEEVINIPSIEADLDLRKLQRIHDLVQDDVAIHENEELKSDVPELPAALRQQLEPYPFLPNDLGPAASKTGPGSRVTIKVAERSLDAIGASILERLSAERSGDIEPPWASAIELELPEDEPRPLLEPPPRKGSEAKPALSNSDSHSHNSREQSAAVVTESALVRDSPLSSRRASTQSPTLARIELPTRKRSTDVAGMPETPDGERQRSKRIRARKSTGGPGANDPAGLGVDTGPDLKNDTTLQADRWLFDLMRDVFRRFDVKLVCNADQLRKLVSMNSPPALGEGPIKLGKAMQDLYQAMLTWNARKTENFLQTKKAEESEVEPTNTGLTAFLDSASSRSGKPTNPVTIWAEVDKFADLINSSWMTTEQAAVAWIQTMVSPARPFDTAEEEPRQSHYMARTWTEGLKTSFDKLLVLVDSSLSKSLQQRLQKHGEGVLDSDDAQARFEIAQSVYEWHLDHYIVMTSPTADEDAFKQMLQRSRLLRWFHIAWEALGSYVARLTEHEEAPSVSDNPLLLRHMWSAIFQLKALDDVSRDHLLACIEDAKSSIGKRTKPVMLPNNNTMSEISPAAADREISKLETMDFFLSIFSEEQQHPVDIVDKLEPILIPTLEKSGRSARYKRRADEEQRSESMTPDLRDSKHELLAEFVSKATPAFRLSLWYRLRDAYQTMQFHPKVLLINFKIISAIINEMQTSQYSEMPAEERETCLLNWLHDIHELLTKCYALIHSGVTGLSDLDFEQMRLSAACMISVFTILHTIALFDDYASALQKGPPLTNPFKAYPSESFHGAALRFHEMKLRTTIILYWAIEEAAAHFPDRPVEQKHVDQYEFLTYIHYELGVRRICKASDNMFLNFMRTELIKLQKSQPIYRDLAQVLHDLYDLNCFASTSEKEDHGCEPDYLDRETAFELVDFVLERAKATNLKDLPKVDLGKSVEKVQNALGPIKSTHAMARNRKMINAYLKAAIEPSDLFQCLKGLSSLSTVAVPATDAPVASKGWYFLMAQINLAKHRRLKGQQPAQEDDLETAITYLGHELEYDSEKWESWFRLAYANDCLIEESVLWSTEKINSPTSDLPQMQRSSIHAYVQAVAVAQRSAEVNDDSKNKLADLYLDFATRLFASTRPPFNMQAFYLSEFPLKHYSGTASGGGIYTNRPYRRLGTLQAYRVAISMLQRAVAFQPKQWTHRFMLGKCYWRVHMYERSRAGFAKETADKALECFHKVVEMLPSRRESSRQEAVLEPIYKLVFVILKMVKLGDLKLREASEKIANLMAKEQRQFDASDIKALTDDEPAQEQWLDFLMSVVKVLRAADKAKWHHRLHYKMADLIYQRHGANEAAAKATQEFMVEEKLYSTKTLALTVWKPESERPGRHWVYMTTYARFVMSMLEQAGDIDSMQLLARRVRRKNNEYYEHTSLWKEVLDAHLRLHRKHYAIPDNADDATMRNLNHEDFRPRADAVDRWCADPGTASPLVDVLREVNEIKKLNALLADNAPVDDLLVDIYTQIYKDVGPTLPVVVQPAAAAAAAAATAAVRTATGTPEPQGLSQQPTPEKPASIMALNNLMAVDSSASAAPQPQQPQQPTDPAPRRTRTITRINILKRAQEATTSKTPGVGSNIQGTGARTGRGADATDGPANDSPPAKTDADGDVAMRTAASSTPAKTPAEVGTSSHAHNERTHGNGNGNGNSGGGGGGGGSDASSELSELDSDPDPLDAPVPPAPAPPSASRPGSGSGRGAGPRGGGTPRGRGSSSGFTAATPGSSTRGSGGPGRPRGRPRGRGRGRGGAGPGAVVSISPTRGRGRGSGGGGANGAANDEGVKKDADGDVAME